MAYILFIWIFGMSGAFSRDVRRVYPLPTVLSQACLMLSPTVGYIPPQDDDFAGPDPVRPDSENGPAQLGAGPETRNQQTLRPRGASKT